jgi:hypothetical protein
MHRANNQTALAQSATASTAMRFESSRAAGRLMHGLRSPIWLGIFLLAGSASLSQVGLQAGHLPVEVNGGNLQLALMQENPRGSFRVELHNAGDRPLWLLLGFVVNRGQYPTEIRLQLTDSDGSVLHLEEAGPPIVGSPIYPMVVPLPAGATFAFPIDLKDYYSRKEKVWNLHLLPGEYTLRAEYTGLSAAEREANLPYRGLATKDCWTGIATSNKVLFTLTQDIGIPRGK